MKDIEKIRNSLTSALIRLNELELSLTKKRSEAIDWDSRTIVNAVANEFGVASELFYAKSCPLPVKYARQVAIYLISKHTGIKYSEVCAHFRKNLSGNVYYVAMKSVMDKMEIDPIYSGKVVRAETAYLIQKNNK